MRISQLGHEGNDNAYHRFCLKSSALYCDITFSKLDIISISFEPSIDLNFFIIFNFHCGSLITSKRLS